MTLREHLKVVVIDLEPGDNAQVIFETLNHRGVPLLAADLIKNLVFQVARDQGRDVPGLYQRHWRGLDTDYWRQRIARGRQYVPRIDIFVNYWLVMKLRREVPGDRIFVEFRDHLLRERPRQYLPYWYSTANSLGRAIADGGFKATRVNLTAERAVLVRQ